MKNLFEIYLKVGFLLQGVPLKYFAQSLHHLPLMMLVTWHRQSVPDKQLHGYNARNLKKINHCPGNSATFMLYLNSTLFFYGVFGSDFKLIDII